MPTTVPERFDARSADGTVYRVIKHQSRIDASHLGGRGSLPGLPEFRLNDGRAVNMIDDTTFQIVETGKQLIRQR